ncbi:hypothetical protein DFH11DRAFT_1850561 [Phellopilus nigrolimitatus]|nr:hypothetical protein DFH11DRAFT_1850561 [Phellopilus nigrolimitatus]
MDLIARPGQDGVSFQRHRDSQHHFCSEADPEHYPQPVHFPSSTYNRSFNVPAIQSAPSKQIVLPGVGQTRCYWTLLNSSLQFLVLDPVLAYHLQDQSARFLEASLLDFVHPEEQDSARQDIDSALEAGTLHGSVTRVRYCRLSRVRRLLGWTASSPPYPPNFPVDRIAVDSDYMAVYLVINCVAEGLVLCFIHAVVDITPREDNDEIRKTGWTNWCSTYGFEQEQACVLYQRLYDSVPPPKIIFQHDSDPPLRVFQILRNQADRPLVLSWPPEASFLQGQYTRPAAQDLARLAQHIQIGYSLCGGGESDARTSCTRRYKSVQNVDVPTTEGTESLQVESIFIPHGMIIFACHKVNNRCLTPAALADEEPPMRTQKDLSYSKMLGHEHQELFQTDQLSYNDAFLTNTSQLVPQAYVQQWVEGQSHVKIYPQYSQQQQQQQQRWDQACSHTDLPPSRFQTGIDSATGVTRAVYEDQWTGQQTHFIDNSATIVAGISYVRSQCPSHASTGGAFSNDVALPFFPAKSTTAVKSSGIVKEESPTPSNDDFSQGCQSPDVTGRADFLKDNYSERERSARSGDLLVGVVRCSSCQTTHSPEWRKGPSGKKDLCNACGLRFARSRAKKEGVTARKRKEKEKEPLSTRRAKALPITAGSNATKNFDQRSSAQSFIRFKTADDSGESTEPSTASSSLPSEILSTPPADSVRSHYLDQTLTQSLTPSPSPPTYFYLPSNRIDVKQHSDPQSSYITTDQYFSLAQSESFLHQTAQQEHGQTELPSQNPELSNQY